MKKVGSSAFGGIIGQILYGLFKEYEPENQYIRLMLRQGQNIYQKLNMWAGYSTIFIKTFRGVGAEIRFGNRTIEFDLERRKVWGLTPEEEAYVREHAYEPAVLHNENQYYIEKGGTRSDEAEARLAELREQYPGCEITSDWRHEYAGESVYNRMRQEWTRIEDKSKEYRKYYFEVKEVIPNLSLNELDELCENKEGK